LIGRLPNSSIFSGEPDVVLEISDLLGADRRDQVLRRQRVGDILSGKAKRLHRARIEIDLDLALLAAIGPRDRSTGHRDQRRAQLVGGEVEQVLLGQSFTCQRKLDDRHGGGVVVQDQRRRRTRRQLPQHGLRDRRDLRVRRADIDIGLEEDLDDAGAVVGIGNDVLDVVDGGGQRALKRRDDASGHLVRRQAGIRPDHPDHRNPDFGENIGRCPQGGERPDDQQQKCQHDERIGSAQGNPDKRIHV
jgi:hypothetical protein